MYRKGDQMIHFIVILHFLSISVGIGCVVLCSFLFHREKAGIYRSLLIGEAAFLGFFLTDSIAIYLRTAVVEHNLEIVIKVFCYTFGAILLISLFIVERYIRTNKLYRNATLPKKLFAGVVLLVNAGYLLNLFTEIFVSVPFLCILYLLQCILVMWCLWKPEINSSREIKLRNNEVFSSLTERENEVVQYICDGLSNKDIAERMFISANTVKNHISNIYRKLEIKNKVELINLINKGD